MAIAKLKDSNLGIPAFKTRSRGASLCETAN